SSRSMVSMFGFTTSGCPRCASTSMSMLVRPKLHLCAGLLVAACGFDSGPPDTPLTTTLGGGDATTSGTTESATSTDESGATSDETTAATTTDGSPCDDGWWNSDWTRRSRLRFRGGEHDAILVDMPVLVVLTPN